MVSEPTAIVAQETLCRRVSKMGFFGTLLPLILLLFTTIHRLWPKEKKEGALQEDMYVNAGFRVHQDQACMDSAAEYKWMWGADVSNESSNSVVHRFKQNYGAYWSRWQSREMVLEQLNGFLDLPDPERPPRPVEVKTNATGDGDVHFYRNESVADLIEWIGGVRPRVEDIEYVEESKITQLVEDARKDNFSRSWKEQYDIEWVRRIAAMARMTYHSMTDSIEAWECDQCYFSGLRVKKETITVMNAERCELRATLARFEGPEHFEDHCILAIRGTQTSHNAIEDLNADYRPMPVKWGCRDCRVHQGFLQYWLSFEKRIVRGLRESTCNETKLYITGHSMGAAVATVAAWPLMYLYKQQLAGVVTFQSPRAFDLLGSETWNAIIGQHVISFRHNSEGDIVPHVPCDIPDAYAHVDTEVYYNRRGTHYFKDIQGTDEQLCSGGLRYVGAQVLANTKNVFAHQKTAYFDFER